jgi:hypothetical protein
MNFVWGYMPGLDRKISFKDTVELFAYICLGRNNLIDLGDNSSEQRRSAQKEEDAEHLCEQSQARHCCRNKIEVEPAQHQWLHKCRLQYKISTTSTEIINVASIYEQ